MEVSALQGEPFDQGNQVGQEGPSAAVGSCWAGQADRPSAR
jgi:hypothetical protein